LKAAFSLGWRRESLILSLRLDRSPATCGTATAAAVQARVGAERARVPRLHGDRLAAQIAIGPGETLRKSQVVHDVNSIFFVVPSAVLATASRIGDRLPH
jgi:hypothetical protein